MDSRCTRILSPGSKALSFARRVPNSSSDDSNEEIHGNNASVLCSTLPSTDREKTVANCVECTHYTEGCDIRQHHAVSDAVSSVECIEWNMF